MGDDWSGLSAKEILKAGEERLKAEREEHERQRKEENKPIFAGMSFYDLKALISFSLGLPLFICICMAWGTHFDISFAYLVKSFLLLVGGFLVTGTVVSFVAHKIGKLRKKHKKH